jgi:ribosomal protein L37E
MSPVDETASQGKANREIGVQCAKCGHENLRGNKACKECGAHLYVTCHVCGHRNQRVLTQCDKCGEGLRRSLWKRWMKKLTPKKAMVKPVHILMLMASVYLAYRIVIRLANL